jgi:hypothetical protein
MMFASYTAKLPVDYVFSGDPASRMIVETREKGAFTVFKFVDDRLIAFEDLVPLPEEVFRGL